MGGGMPGGMGGMGGGAGGFDLSDLLGGLGGLGGMGAGGMGANMGQRRASGMKRGRPSHSGSEGPIPRGTEVTIQGLKSTPQLNGKAGVIADYDPATSRHVVQIPVSQGQVKTVKVRPQNLVQRCQVKIEGLSAQEYNGKQATVVGVKNDGERYVCQLPGNKLLSLKPEKLRLSPGTHVRVEGLKSQPKWNNRWAQVESYVNGSQRYRVRMMDQPAKKLDLKPANLRV